MIVSVVVALFLLTAVLMAVRFFRKRDPFGGLDADDKRKEFERAKATRNVANPEEERDQ